MEYHHSLLNVSLILLIVSLAMWYVDSKLKCGFNFKLQLIKVLVGKRPMAMNLDLMRGLYFYKNENGYYENIRISRREDLNLPEDVGFYFHDMCGDTRFNRTTI